MVLQGEAIGYVALNAFGAMTKVALVAAVGFYFALYPKTDPYLSSSALKYISRISTAICLPALIVASVGSGLSVGLLSRIGILLLFCFFNGFISASLASTVGKWIDKSSSAAAQTALFVAISCPNVVSLPLMVFQSLCSQPIVTVDYEGSSARCFTDSSTMIFLYSIGWHLMYWSYFFPLLQGINDTPTESESLKTTNNDTNTYRNEKMTSSTVPEQDTKIPFARPSLARSRSSYYWSQSQSFIASFRNPKFGSQNRSFRNAFSDFESHMVISNLKTIGGWCQTVLLSPVMVSIYIGVFIGLIAPLQKILFFDPGSALSPFGAALVTLGEPTVCLNSLIMAASLAKVDLQWSEALASAQNTLDRWSTRVEDLLFNTHKYASVTSTSNTSTATATRDTENVLSKEDNSSEIAFLSKLITSTSMIDDSKYSHGRDLQSTTISPLHASSQLETTSISIQDNHINNTITPIEEEKKSTDLSRQNDSTTLTNEQSLIPTEEPYNTENTANTTIVTESTDKVKRPHWRSIMSLFVCRMMLPGVFAILLLQLFIASGVISKSDKMMQTVIILVSSGPPAQLVIVSLNQLELSRTAGALAYLYLFTYIASILVMTVWATIAMSLVY